MDTRKILNRFYPEAEKGDSASAPPGKRKPLSLRQGIRILYDWIGSLGLRGLLVVLLIAVCVAPTLYYHNTFLDLRYNCLAAWADVQAMMQARAHIRQGLIRTVIDYSQYERDILTKLTQLRIGPSLTLPEKNADGQANESAEPPSQQTPLDKMTPQQVEAVFARIKIVAEQYPQIKATENYQQFGAALIESERKIVELIIKYNNSANIYTTAVETWPARFFAWLMGFEPMGYYVPDAGTQQFEKAEFR